MSDEDPTVSPERPDELLEKMAQRMEELMVQTFENHQTTQHYLADVLLCMALMRTGDIAGGETLRLTQRIAETYANDLVRQGWYA